MSDYFEEQFSALVDGEETLSEEILSRIKNDGELVQRWNRYHLVKDTLKGHLDDHSFADISTQVSRAIANEPAILAPAAIKSRHKPSRMNYWYKQAAGYAVAATVATVAVLGVQQAQQQTVGQLQTAQASKPAPQIKFVAANTAEQPRLDSAVESKLSGYLVQHNEYSVSSKMQGALPYMRIVSVTPGKRLESNDTNE